MIQKQNKYKSITFIWVAIFSLTFTTLSFYDFNPKYAFIEISEEVAEDGGDINEEDGDISIGFESILHDSKIIFTQNSNFSSSVQLHKAYSTCTGYMLDLIKPPLN